MDKKSKILVEQAQISIDKLQKMIGLLDTIIRYTKEYGHDEDAIKDFSIKMSELQISDETNIGKHLIN